jgi:branched-subunit amino acid transport protein
MRTVPILLLSRFRLAPVVQQWLSFIPAAIMAAIITAELMGKPALTASGISGVKPEIRFLRFLYLERLITDGAS